MKRDPPLSQEKRVIPFVEGHALSCPSDFFTASEGLPITLLQHCHKAQNPLSFGAGICYRSFLDTLLYVVI